MRWLFSIRLRLTAWYILLLAVILTAFSLVLYAALSTLLYRGVDDRLRAEAGAAAASLGQSEIEFEEGGESHAPPLPASGLPMRLLDKKGREVGATGGLRGAPVDADTLDAARQGGAFHNLALNNGQAARAYVVPLLKEGKEWQGFLEVAESLSVIQTSVRALALILLLAVPATLALASFGGLFIADRALRPIDAITREAQYIGEHHLDRRLNLDLPDDEAGRLARTFDAMLDRLDAAFKRQRQFTADASHELRTPLTVMKGNIGVALNRPRTAEEYQTALLQLEGEVDRLTRLTENLLLLARADAGRPLVQPRDVDAAALARDVVDDFRPLAEAKSLELSVAAPDALPMRGDPDRLHRLLFNLIDNAVKYTERGSVAVRVERGPGNPPSIRFVVADTGPGIAAEHLPRLFERFYRADESRSREQGGVGLGLAIAHSIAAAHGGAVEVASEFGCGTTFVVTLPLQS
jgi:heavy metal sensor kinase